MSNNLKAVIDELGAVMAAKAEIVKREKALKEALADLDKGSYDGKEFSLLVSSYKRGDLDKDAVLKKLGEKWVKAHTRMSDIRKLSIGPMENKKAA